MGGLISRIVLKSTTSRSARLFKGNKAIPFTELKTLRTREFRPSKKDKNLIVQTKGLTRGYGEVQEIKLFKNKSKKKKKFNFWDF